MDKSDAVSDQSLHCLTISQYQQKVNLFKFLDKYGKELWSPNIYGE